MRILILSHRVPFPQNGGYAIVVANTIKGLVNSGHTVSLIALNAKRHNYESHLPDDDLMGKITYWAHDIDTTVTVLDVAVNLFKRHLLTSTGFTTKNLSSYWPMIYRRTSMMLYSWKACLYQCM
ncbi:hypothetical protein [Mucilaginibacter antarcticus]|uniref:hypothetical protein n=1 Tax=Mucilaginibacter antarcticus TaxID=1855725 RepID=UPI003633A532